MDNMHIDLSLVGLEEFRLAMKIACSKHSHVIGYRIHENTMILYWAKNDNCILLPYEMDVNQVVNFVWGWLEKTPPNYPEPDHDGDNGRGFRVYNESWGHIKGEWQAFIAIMPIWAMYGK